MKVSVFFFVCLMFVCACTGRKQQVADEIKVLQAKEIQIPSKSLVMKREVRSTELLIANTNFDYPILIDTLGEFERLNPHLPKNQALHTFLLDENNRVILVGNPLRNKKIKEMFYKRVEGTAIKFLFVLLV